MASADGAGVEDRNPHLPTEANIGHQAAKKRFLTAFGMTLQGFFQQPVLGKNGVRS
jgi:hypothetical protein